ncbi:MAG: putative bifunctional diguanylate cyclase/phosphodiesterase, partial [Prochlorothrix sp.]
EFQPESPLDARLDARLDSRSQMAAGLVADWAAGGLPQEARSRSQGESLRAQIKAQADPTDPSPSSRSTDAYPPNSLWPMLLPQVGDVLDWQDLPVLQPTLKTAFHAQNIRLLLVLPLRYQDQPLGYLTLFRRAQQVELHWAGQHSSDPRDRRPRESFELWREEREMVLPWREEELQLAQTLALHLYLLLIQRWLRTLSLHHSTHDTLTHLPNAKLLHQYLSVRILQLLQAGEVLAVGILNLDRFKTINESFGHIFGDQLLRDVADRLEEALQQDYSRGRQNPPDLGQGEQTDRSPVDREVPLTLGRWHGDSFVLVLTQVQGHEDVAQRSQAILAVFDAPFQVQGQSIYLTASFGVALAPYHGDTDEVLLKHAEVAMYAAKSRGRNTVQLYQPPLSLNQASRPALESDLRQAIEKEEFVLHYQPQVSLETGEVVGVEALIRWQHPRMGLIAPSQFIGRAEELGMLKPLSTWVLEKACRQYQHWCDQGWPPLRIAINISPSQFDSPNFSQELEEIVQQTGIPSQFLELEITEETTARDLHRTVERLQGLHQRGFYIALDDFGQGYSCLSALKHFPIHTLKIDRTFIKDIPQDKSDMAIAKTIAALGEGLGLQVLAEGVETLDQVKFLRLIGCDLVQGYLVSRPLPAEALEQWLVRWRTNPLFGPRSEVRNPAPHPAIGLDLGSEDWLAWGQNHQPTNPAVVGITCPLTDSPHLQETDLEFNPLTLAPLANSEQPQAVTGEYIALRESLLVEIRQERLINEIAQKIRQSLDLDDILNAT